MTLTLEEYQEARVNELMGIICVYCAITENNRVDELLDQIAMLSPERYYSFDAIFTAFRNDTPPVDTITPEPLDKNGVAVAKVKALSRFCQNLASAEYFVARNDQNKVPTSLVIPKLIESLSVEVQALANIERGSAQVS